MALEQAGILRPSASVLDLGHDQVALIAAVYGLTMPWRRQPGYRARVLGAILKVCPTDVAETAGQLLRRARLVPPEPEE